MTHRIAILSILSLMLVACDALEGPEGPEGPQGPPGAANVETFIVSYSAEDVIVDGPVGLAPFEAPAITQDVYDNGTVQAFFELADQWLALPWTITAEGTTLEVSYAYDVETFAVVFLTNQPSLSPGNVVEGRVKVVVIPPSDSNSTSAGHKAENLDLDIDG